MADMGAVSGVRGILLRHVLRIVDVLVLIAVGLAASTHVGLLS